MMSLNKTILHIHVAKVKANIYIDPIVKYSSHRLLQFVTITILLQIPIL